MKRQEEIKLEEERLKRETEIIECERQQAEQQMMTRNEGLFSLAKESLNIYNTWLLLKVILLKDCIFFWRYVKNIRKF